MSIIRRRSLLPPRRVPGTATATPCTVCIYIYIRTRDERSLLYDKKFGLPPIYLPRARTVTRRKDKSRERYAGRSGFAAACDYVEEGVLNVTGLFPFPFEREDKWDRWRPGF